MRSRDVVILAFAAVVALAVVSSCSRGDKPAPAAQKAAPAKPAAGGTLDRARIVPVMWPKGAARTDTVSEPFNEDLVILYVEDTGKEIRFLMPQDLERAGVKREELRALAVSNLKTVMPGPQLHKGAEYSMVIAGGNYESSLLLTPQIWTGDAMKVDGDIVVAVPGRNLLFVTGTKTPGGIAKVREITAKAMRESPNRLTETLFVLKDGQFVKLAQ